MKRVTSEDAQVLGRAVLDGDSVTWLTSVVAAMTSGKGQGVKFPTVQALQTVMEEVHVQVEITKETRQCHSVRQYM